MEEIILNKVEEKIKNIVEKDITPESLEWLYKLTKIRHITKEDMNMYGNYGNYGGRGPGHGAYGEYGNYGENYGRRGYDARYRGTRPEDKIDEMYMNYQAYSEGREAYGRGNYGAREDSMMCLETMLESMEDFVKMLKEEASSQEEIELIRKYVKKISEM